jgi:TonB family protein
MKNIRRTMARDLAHAGVIALLFAGTFAFGQGTWKQLPSGDPNQDPPALRGPSSNQTAQVGEIEVVNGPVSFHIRNYLSFGVLANIRTNWQRVLSEKGLIPVSASEQKTFAVEFTVLKDGTLESRKVVESSGDAGLDGAGLDAIAKSAPFMPIPAGFSDEFLKVRCHFYLNPDRRIRAVSRVGSEAGPTDVADNTSTAGAGRLRGNSGGTKPVAIYAPIPPFSDQARKAKVQGTILLAVTVSASGDVADVKVVKGLGSGLDENAVATVRTWKFKPGTEDGNPVKSEINVEVSFHLFN